MTRNQLFAPITKNTITNLGDSVVVEDNEQPLSYKEWLKRTNSIRHGFEIEEYNNYISQWNAIKNKRSDLAEKIKEDYVAFIRSISLFFSEEDKKKFDDSFKLDNYLNLEEIIPHCATKLRDIMVYYQNKRDSIKRIKLKYNLVGTELGIERMLHDYILRAFTKTGSYIKLNDADSYDSLPALKDVNTSLEIKIDELYDDTEYFDKSSAVSPSSYFHVPATGTESAEFYASKGYSSEKEIEWLFGTGFTGVVGEDRNAIAELADESASEINRIVSEIRSALRVDLTGEDADLPLSAFVDYDKDETVEYYKKELTKKYLGEDQYVLNGGYYVNKYIDLEYDISPGNNWIYFPSGEFSHETPDLKIKPIPLSGTTLISNENVVGASSYMNADKIFKRGGGYMEGAWLKDVSTEYSQKTMVCNLYGNRSYVFMFPYPDYGISGEGIEWGGAGLDNTDQTFYTLPIEDQRGIMKAYWDSSPNVRCNPVALTRSTLIDCGAVASNHYTSADRISIRKESIHDSNPNGVYAGDVGEAFLYKVASSDIPVLPQQNYIYWPYQNVTQDGVVDLPRGGCEPVCLSADEFRTIYGSRAGYGLFDSDIIYKLDGPNGHPIECAFLSGVPFTNLTAMSEVDGWENTTWTDNATGCFQVGRYGKCNPNCYFTFMWLDEDTPMDEVVFHIEHRDDCPYRFEKKFSLYENHPDSTTDESISFDSWKKCDCGAIVYSPFGHPGKKYDDFEGYADCCFVDNTFPLPFDKNVWFGDDIGNGDKPNGYKNSSDFGWYQLTGTSGLEPDCGWGAGRWVAGGDNPTDAKFILKKGRQYKYYRAGAGHTDANLMNGTMPPVYVTHKTTKQVLEITKPKWVRCVLDQNGEWQPTDKMSDMIIRADDNIVYDHIDAEWWCVTGNESEETWTETTDISPYIDDENYLEFVEYNVVPVSSYVVEASWPDMQSEKLPSLPVASQIDIVKWYVDMSDVVENGGIISRTLPVGESMDFTSLQPGFVGVTAIGYTNVSYNASADSYDFDDAYHPLDGATAVFGVTFEAPIEATVTSANRDVYTASAETIGFPLNIPLRGWDYDKCAPAGASTPMSAFGARPVWGEASNLADRSTRMKGVEHWGGGVRLVDDYVPIMQPVISDIVISGGDSISYDGRRAIQWVQPIDVVDSRSNRVWCKLVIDQDAASNLSSELSDLDFKELVVSGTDDPSDMVLESTVDGDPVVLNYWANGSFVWNERVVDISNGVAPTGGQFVDASYDKWIVASEPWKNLSNRHNPTIAVAPVVDNFYNIRDVGGYVIPQRLGMSVAVGKNTKSVPDHLLRSDATGESVITSPSVYAEDASFTKTENNLTMRMTNSDVAWMKTPITNGKNSGSIRSSDKNQQFMSYQSVEERRGGFHDIGLNRPNDLFDPWKGDLDTTWRSELYESHFTHQIPVAAVRRTYVRTDKIKQWVQDIYGYSYGLWKDVSEYSDYRCHVNKEKYCPGIPYVRTETGVIIKLSDAITGAGIEDEAFWGIDVVSDVLILIGNSRIVYYKLVYDENIDLAYKIKDMASNVRYVSMSDLGSDARVVGIWKYPAQARFDVVYFVRDEASESYRFVVDRVQEDWLTFSRLAYEPRSATEIGVDFSSGIIGPVMSHKIGGRSYVAVIQFRDRLDEMGTFVQWELEIGSDSQKVSTIEKTSFS